MNEDETGRAARTQRKSFGGGTGRTILQLAIASIIVGAIFSFVGLGALDFWEGVFSSIKGLVESIGESFSEIVINLITWLIIGAAVVVPIWLIAKLLTSRRN